VTSRRKLGVEGEREWLVLPLATPSAPGTPERLLEFASVQLFVDRAQAVRPGFRLTKDNSSTVARLCERLEGLPLALELAAAWASLLTPAQMLARLEPRFELLVSYRKDIPPRHRSLRAALDSSYRLLPADLQTFLARLSVFRGGWDLEEAEVVCAAPQALEVLLQLQERSLILTEEVGETMRFRMLEAVREFAREQLEEEAWKELAQRHLDYFLKIAEEAEGAFFTPQQAAWLHRLEREHDNFRGSLAFSLETASGAEQGLRLAGALWRFWLIRGYYSEGREWLGRLLTRSNSEDGGPTRARALNGAAVLAIHQGDQEASRKLLEESLTIWRRLENKKGIADCLNNLGLMAWRQRDHGTARIHLEESLAIRRELGDAQRIADNLNNLGNIASTVGDLRRARDLYQESLAIRRELGDISGIASALNNLGNIACKEGDYAAGHEYYEESLTLERTMGNRQGMAEGMANLGSLNYLRGDYAAARGFYEESLAIRRELGDRLGISTTLNSQAKVARREGDFATARALHRESLSIDYELGNRAYIAISLFDLGWVCVDKEEMERAATLWGAAEALREAIGTVLSTMDRSEYERCLASIQAALGERAFAAAWSAGRMMPLMQAIEMGLDSPSSSQAVLFQDNLAY
jgi:predicted ATPase/Tfp pilus assembly protein PilF